MIIIYEEEKGVFYDHGLISMDEHFFRMMIGSYCHG